MACQLPACAEAIKQSRSIFKSIHLMPMAAIANRMLASPLTSIIYMTKDVSLPAHPLAAIAICIAISIAGCSGDQGPERFGFTGKVTVNGKPAHRMIVQLTHLDPQTGERERYVSSKTNESGEFVFGNRADGTPSGFQGAVAGKYSVTFSWMSTDDLDAVDQFAGKFTDSARSSFQVTVPVPPEAPPVVFAIQTHP